MGAQPLHTYLLTCDGCPAQRTSAFTDLGLDEAVTRARNIGWRVREHDEEYTPPLVDTRRVYDEFTCPDCVFAKRAKRGVN